MIKKMRQGLICVNFHLKLTRVLHDIHVILNRTDFTYKFVRDKLTLIIWIHVKLSGDNFCTWDILHTSNVLLLLVADPLFVKGRCNSFNKKVYFIIKTGSVNILHFIPSPWVRHWVRVIIAKLINQQLRTNFVVSKYENKVGCLASSCN